MRKNHILSALAMAAVTFGVTACADTDAQYSIPGDVSAFDMVRIGATCQLQSQHNTIFLMTQESMR